MAMVHVNQTLSGITSHVQNWVHFLLFYFIITQKNFFSFITKKRYQGLAGSLHNENQHH